MYSNLTFSKLKVEPVWVGGFNLGHIQAEANSSIGRVWLDFYMDRRDTWEVSVSDGNTQDYLTTAYCHTNDVIGLLMYVQINEEDVIDKHDVIYRGKVYTLDTNKKVCDFEWSLQEGTMYVSADLVGRSANALEDFIDEQCYEIYNGDK